MLDSSGLVLTNYHVVEGSTSVSVTVATTGETYDATVVGHDQTADVALLQLDDASGLATVDLDDDGDPSVSDTVTAVGNAQGQGFLSASTGSVVALDQSIDTQSEGTVEGEHLTGLIQTNAYVVGGYSGGALLDDEGEVVGITTAASSGGETQSYAVPIEDALDVAQQIEDGNELRRGAGRPVGVPRHLDQPRPTNGVQVGQIESGGAAAEAGVEAGSIITGLDDTAITSLDVLRSALATYAARRLRDPRAGPTPPAPTTARRSRSASRPSTDLRPLGSARGRSPCGGRGRHALRGDHGRRSCEAGRSAARRRHPWRRRGPERRHRPGDRRLPACSSPPP